MSIRLSDYTIKAHETFSGQEIIIDTKLTNRGFGTFTFDNCKLIFQDNGSLEFENCIIKSCIFQGINNFQDFKVSSGLLNLNQCKEFYNNTFQGQFWLIILRECKIRKFTDSTIVKEYTIISTEIKDFDITGSCENLNTNQVRFLPSSDSRHSKWDKGIFIEANCIRTIYHHVNVNPYYLATKCNDKSTLDISTARLIDNWSKLRKRYAGLSLFIVFFLTFLFFLPLFTHAFILITLSKFDGTLNLLQKTPLWKAILFGGKHGIVAFLYCILTIILLLYNCGRIYMTVTIAKLRQEEMFLKDANFNLVLISPEKYKQQIAIDKVLQYMFYISILYTVFKFFDALKINVPSP